MGIKKDYYLFPEIITNKEYQQIEDCLKHAFTNIKTFISQNAININTSKQLVTKVIVYDSYELFISVIKKLFKLSPEAYLPPTVSATIVDRELHTVTQDLYKDIFPIEGKEEKGYERLITHELAHQLHIDILKGSEEQMGPKWFFEGFALYVANQFVDAPKISKDRMKTIIKENLDVAYIEYASLFHEILKTYSINHLISQINSQIFIEELLFLFQ